MLGYCCKLPCRVRFRRRAAASFLLCLFLFSFFLLSTLLRALQWTKPLRVRYIRHIGNSSSACRLPKLDPFHPSVLRFIEDLGKLHCDGTSYSTVKNNVIYVRGENIVSVKYSRIERPSKDDFNTEVSQPLPILNTIKDSLSSEGQQHHGLFGKLWSFWKPQVHRTFHGTANVESDFIWVDIATPSGTISEVHMNVFPKKEVFSRNIQPAGIPLNVALIMFDSTSLANFIRKMPRSLDYLTKTLSSVILQGETIVGDGTTAQLSAMLTGIAEEEQPEARKDQPSSDTVDKWNWVFKDFMKRGYATLFSEDSPHFGSFNYRLHGFKDPPTDHYGRPFWLEADKIISEYCINSQPSHVVSFGYLLDFFRVYKNRPKFAFISHADISHENPNTIGYADEDLTKLLQTLENKSFLNSTLLVVFSDHGARFSNLRKTIQGKLEERLPFLSITTPKWFPQKYQELHANLVNNSKILTTPFDVYVTLRHILSYPNYPKDITRGQSLFSRIDEETRTCANAGVKDHWCPCLNLEEVPLDEPVVRELAELVVNHINSLTSQSSEVIQLCHRLALLEVKSAFRDMPSEALQVLQSTKRDKKCDSCRLVVGAKSENTLAKNTLYQLQIVTSPNEGFYEATVSINNGVPLMTGEISRIDAYKGQETCLQDKYPRLRKYCYCRKLFINPQISMN